MRRSLSALALLAAIPLAPSFGGPPTVPTTNAFVREPVVVFDTTVSTFPGQVETSLVAYNDGRVVFTSNAFPWSSAGEVVFVTARLDPAIVARLLSDILDVGVLDLEDALPGPGEATITVLEPVRGRSHIVTYGSFSFPHLKVTTAVNDFVSAYLVP